VQSIVAQYSTAGTCGIKTIVITTTFNELTNGNIEWKNVFKYIILNQAKNNIFRRHSVWCVTKRKQVLLYFENYAEKLIYVYKDIALWIMTVTGINLKFI